jgi:hypothetical protein
MKSNYYSELLNEKWEFRWDERDAEWLGATVPGDVHLDLIRNRLLDEPLHGFASLEAQNLEERVWFYRKEFDFAEPVLSFRARLVFEGLDCFGEIQLNGQLLGLTENAFVAHSFDVTDALRGGLRLSPGGDRAQSRGISRVSRKLVYPFRKLKTVGGRKSAGLGGTGWFCRGEMRVMLNAA